MYQPISMLKKGPYTQKKSEFSLCYAALHEIETLVSIS